jgi:hypothetical protein
MKTLKVFSLAFALMAFAGFSNAQSVTEKFKVSGNCGMCKAKIEKAAKDAGATAADWDVDSKEIKVSFNSSSTSMAKIQKKIAKVGYDNAGATASQESYDKLHGCCKYERVSSNEAKVSCCKEGECSKCAGCDEKCSEGKCENCKEGKACSQEGKCTSGGDCCKKS